MYSLSLANACTGLLNNVLAGSDPVWRFNKRDVHDRVLRNWKRKGKGGALLGGKVEDKEKKKIF